MAEGKDIKIRIAATGAGESAAEFEKAEQAIRDLTGEVEDGAKAAENFTKKLDSAEADRAASARKKEVAISIGAIGTASAAAVRALNDVREAFESVDTVSLRGIDSAMADQIERAKSWVNALSDPIGELLKFATGETVASAFAGMNEQIELTAKQQADAIDRIIDKGIKQADEIKKLTGAILAANAILDARDKAEAAERDNKDAAAVRSGASPEDVAAARAKDDAAKEVDRINRGLDPKIAEVQTAFENLQNRKINAQTLETTPGAKPEDLTDALAKVREAQQDFENQKAELEDLKQIADLERRAARAVAAGKVDGLSADKAERLQKEKAAAEKQAADEKARNDRESARSEESGFSGRSFARDSSEETDSTVRPDPFKKLSAVEDGNRRAAERQRDREERGGRKEGSLELRDRNEGSGIPRDAIDQFRSDVKKASQGNGDGGGDQMGEVLSLMKSLAAGLAAQSGGGGKDYSKEIEDLKRDVKILEQRQRNR